MSREIIAAVCREPGSQYSLERLHLGQLNHDEVYIKILASGICHTDFIAEHLVPLPAVFGHEGCGIIQEVGQSVTNFKVGERVVISYPHCGSCSGCSAGKLHLCDEHMSLAFKGTRLDGSNTTAIESAEVRTSFFQQSSFATHCIVNSRYIVKITSDEPNEIIASIPCGVQTGAGSVINTFNAGPLDSIAVFGVGAVGLSAVIAANISGVGTIIAIDIDVGRLNLALDLGAHYSFNANDPDLLKKINSCSRGGVTYSLETSGNDRALESAIACLQTGGKCGMVISPNFGQKYPFSPTDVFKGAKSLFGIIQGSAIPRIFLPKILSWYEQGKFPLDRLIKTYPFTEINRAAKATKDGETIKAILTMN